jgi:hypothetical protein
MYICIFSNKFDLNQAIRVSHTFTKLSNQDWLNKTTVLIFIFVTNLLFLMYYQKLFRNKLDLFYISSLFFIITCSVRRMPYLKIWDQCYKTFLSVIYEFS